MNNCDEGGCCMLCCSSAWRFVAVMRKVVVVAVVGIMFNFFLTLNNKTESVQCYSPVLAFLCTVPVSYGTSVNR